MRLTYMVWYKRMEHTTQPKEQEERKKRKSRQKSTKNPKKMMMNNSKRKNEWEEKLTAAAAVYLSFICDLRIIFLSSVNRKYFWYINIYLIASNHRGFGYSCLIFLFLFFFVPWSLCFYKYNPKISSSFYIFYSSFAFFISFWYLFIRLVTFIYSSFHPFLDDFFLSWFRWLCADRHTQT